MPVVEGDRAAAHFGGEFDGAFVRAVGDEDRAGAARDEALGGDAAHFAGADEHDLAVAEVAEDFLCEFDCDAADRGGAFLDGCLGADFFADAECALEETVEHAGGRAGIESGLVGLFHLTEDFRFAEHH